MSADNDRYHRISYHTDDRTVRGTIRLKHLKEQESEFFQVEIFGTPGSEGAVIVIYQTAFKVRA